MDLYRRRVNKRFSFFRENYSIACTQDKRFNVSDCYFPEEVILAEERTTEEERQHIIEARKRTMNKRKKMIKSMGKSRSAETDEDEDEADDGECSRVWPP